MIARADAACVDRAEAVGVEHPSRRKRVELCRDLEQMRAVGRGACRTQLAAEIAKEREKIREQRDRERGRDDRARGR